MLSIAPTTADGITRVWMAGVCLDALSERELVDQVIAASAVGRGGWIATPNVHFLRRAGADNELRELLAGATHRVADGMPLSWASRLARAARLERVPGSDLIFSLTEAAARHGRTVYIVGGRDDAAAAAAARFTAAMPTLRVVGAEGPWVTDAVTADEVEPIIARLEAAQPDIVFCGFGFPKQERFIGACRKRLPNAWFVGCGAAVNFAAGYESRAPRWMQRLGLEWIYRLLSEPRRLARRYAGDLPFALHILVVSMLSGLLPRGAWRAEPYPSDTVVLPDAVPEPHRVIDLTASGVLAAGPADVIRQMPAGVQADAG
jgi:N-acetylglucosaminyldiphosphoundecaprenol N-acetyl-beta-D-mannosaminyltransferase